MAERSVTVETQAEDKAQEEEEDAVTVDPPETTLPYKISEELFQKARKAAPDTPESFWTYTMYRKVGKPAGNEEEGKEGKVTTSKSGGGGDDQVTVYYCKNKLTTERVCQYFLNEPIVGFDLEWMPEAARFHSARWNVSLVQLASPSRIALFQLALFPATKTAGRRVAATVDDDRIDYSQEISDLVAPTMKRILEDPAILKLGVAIKGDCTRLRNFLQIDAKGIFELSHLHRLVKYSRSGQTGLINKKLVSLADQVHEHLRLPLFKGSQVRSSDWTKPLSMEQVRYSASDAYAAVQLFSALEKQRKELVPTPPRPAPAELNLPIRLAGGVLATTAAKAAAVAAAAPEEADSGLASAVSEEQLSEAAKQVTFEADCEEPTETATTSTNSARPATSKSATKDPRVEEAEKWAQMYREGKTTTVWAKPANLRAYRLWYSNADLDPAAVAAVLRTPPLKTNTVAGYILEALRLERLPFDKARVRSELLDHIPESMAARRYHALSRACNYKGPSPAARVPAAAEAERAWAA